MTNDEFDFNDDEQVIAQAKFNKIPLIILWVVIGIFTICYVVSGLVTKFAPIVTVILPAAFVILLGVVAPIRFLNRQFIITDKRIIKIVGLLFIKETDLPLSKIQAVSVSQNFFEKWLNYGTLTVQNAAIIPVGYRIIGIKDCFLLHETLMEAISLNCKDTENYSQSKTQHAQNTTNIKSETHRMQNASNTKSETHNVQNTSNTKPDSSIETIKASKTPTSQVELSKKCDACGTYNNSTRTTCIHCGKSLEN